MERDKTGKYAELLNQYVEHIYKDNIEKSVKRYIFTTEYGVEREIDLFVTLKDGSNIAFEVRDRVSTQGIEWIDQVVGKYHDTNFKEIWICTFDGCKLSKNAIKKLTFHNIHWRSFHLLNDLQVDDKNPFVWINGIFIDTENIKLQLNGDLYTDLFATFNENEKPYSVRNKLIDELKHKMLNDFSSFLTKNSETFERTYIGEAVEKSFHCTELRMACEIPLQHVTFYDFFSEEYSVVNSGDKMNLFVSKNNTVFVTDNKLVINLYNLEQLYCGEIQFDNSLLLSLENIPKKYLPITSIQFIHPNGVSNIVPMAIYGIKR